MSKNKSVISFYMPYFELANVNMYQLNRKIYYSLKYYGNVKGVFGKWVDFALGWSYYGEGLLQMRQLRLVLIITPIHWTTIFKSMLEAL